MGRTGKRRETRHRAETLVRHEVRLMLEKGRSALRRRRLEEAAKAFGRVLAIEPAHPAALAGLGEVHLRRGESAPACDLLERALASGPQSEHLLYSLANACRGAQRRDKAFRYFEQLVDRNPSHLKGLTRFGEACLGRKDFERAAAVFRQALELDPQNLYALRGLASALRGRRQYQEAIPVYEDLLRLAPSDHRVLVRLGEAYAHVGDHANAERALRLALRIDPENRYARDGLAKLGLEDNR